MKVLQLTTIASLVLLLGINTFSSAKKCIHKADIGFVVDSSGSESQYWSYVKEWIKKMTIAFGIEAGRGNHGGLVLFSHEAKTHISFGDHATVEEFNDAVDRLPAPSGGTSIESGLEVAYDELFEDARSNAHRTVIVMTDGQNGAGIDPIKEAIKPYHDDYIRVIVVGIGAVDETELKAMIQNDQTHDDQLFTADAHHLLLEPEFIENIIEGCNLHIECPAKQVELLGGTHHTIQNVNSWKTCREKCKNNEGMNGQQCHYYQWWDASAGNHNIPLKRKTPYSCELKTDQHCGQYGSSCVKREHKHGVAGSSDANCPY
jgi:hypothetical protein